MGVERLLDITQARKTGLQTFAEIFENHAEKLGHEFYMQIESPKVFLARNNVISASSIITRKRTERVCLRKYNSPGLKKAMGGGTRALNKRQTKQKPQLLDMRFERVKDNWKCCGWLSKWGFNKHRKENRRRKRRLGKKMIYSFLYQKQMGWLVANTLIQPVPGSSTFYRTKWQTQLMENVKDLFPIKI